MYYTAEKGRGGKRVHAKAGFTQRPQRSAKGAEKRIRTAEGAENTE
jgi:hypothetical protein